MNSYITLDGKQYATKHKAWMPITLKPVSVRPLWDATVDVTYGPVGVREWRGIILVPYSANDPWGGLDDLTATLEKTEAVTYVDHHGNSYTVFPSSDVMPDSLIPMWDSPSNEFSVEVRLVKNA